MSSAGMHVHVMNLHGSGHFVYGERSEENTVYVQIQEDYSDYEDLRSFLDYTAESAYRTYHADRVILLSPEPFMQQALNACLFYQRGRDYMHETEPWRKQLPDDVFDEEGYIINQGKMEKIPFGWFNTKDKGCGWIAAYNFLKITGHEKSMEECAHGLEKHAPLGEAIGQEEILLYYWLKKQGIPVRMTLQMNHSALQAMKNKEAGILLYTHAHGGHYTAWKNLHDGSVHFYNAVYGRTDHIEKPEAFLKKNALFPVSSCIYLDNRE